MKRLPLILVIPVLYPIAILQAAQLPDLEGEENPAWWVESMKNRDQRLEWYRDAKFGMFVHWGVYSYLGGEWKGQIAPGYSEHILRTLQIPLGTYAKEVAGKFNPVKFDADEWIRLCKAAGMRYFVITSKHHDGLAMWPSDVNEWDIDDATPFDRDPLAELRDACRKYGIHFGFYYSQAQDWSHPGGQRNTWDYPYQPASKSNWWRDPDYAGHIQRSEKYIREKSIPQLLEIVDRYDPEIIWFDTSSWVPLYQNKMVLKALREVAPDIVVSSRIGGNLGDYQSTTDQPDDFQHYYRQFDTWEGIPTTNMSYGYHKHDDAHKPASFFIELLAECAEKGGNLLMNVGPMGNGLIDPRDVKILKGIGAWMDINGESIYGTTYSPLAPHTFGHISRKKNRLYLHVTNWPEDGVITVAGLNSTVRKAWLLADPDQKELTFRKTAAGDIRILGPKKAVDPVNTVIVVETVGEPVGEKDAPVRLATNLDVQRLHVFDAHELNGGLRYGSGNPGSNGVIGWGKSNMEDGSVVWKIRVDEPASFGLDLVYVAVEDQHGGQFILQVDDQKFVAETLSQPKPDYPKKVIYTPHNLGVISMEPGEHTITLKGSELTGRELFMPSRILLRHHQ